MSAAIPGAITRGVVFIHSAPAVMCPHVQWALEHALRQPLRIEWQPQPAGPRLHRAEVSWSGPVGTGAAMTSALRGWDQLRFEITEEPTAVTEGSRWQHTPSLGIHRAAIGPSGDAVIGEERIRAALTQTAGDPYALQDVLEELLGSAWDAELEPFRYAGEGAPVRWLHRAV